SASPMPSTPQTVPPTKAPSNGPGALRLITVGVLAFLLATVTGRLDLSNVVSGVRDSIARNPAVQKVTGTAGTSTVTDAATVAAIKDLIQRANDAQAKALAQNDSSLMRDTATDSYYQELMAINRDLASGGSFTAVTATWVVPQVSATSTGADATWVGIGGLNSRDLIQAGTQASVGGGSVTYEAWVEMLPQSSRTVSLSVNPGDSVTTS